MALDPSGGIEPIAAIIVETVQGEGGSMLPPSVGCGHSVKLPLASAKEPELSPIWCACRNRSGPVSRWLCSSCDPNSILGARASTMEPSAATIARSSPELRLCSFGARQISWAGLRNDPAFWPTGHGIWAARFPVLVSRSKGIGTMMGVELALHEWRRWLQSTRETSASSWSGAEGDKSPRTTKHRNRSVPRRLEPPQSVD